MPLDWQEFLKARERVAQEKARHTASTSQQATDAEQQARQRRKDMEDFIRRLHHFLVAKGRYGRTTVKRAKPLRSVYSDEKFKTVRGWRITEPRVRPDEDYDVTEAAVLLKDGSLYVGRYGGNEVRFRDEDQLPYGSYAPPTRPNDVWPWYAIPEGVAQLLDELGLDWDGS